VIATGVLVDAGSASHFTHHDHKCFVEHTAFIEVAEEREEGSVGGGTRVFRGW
jgi:hypothetical protein